MRTMYRHAAVSAALLTLTGLVLAAGCGKSVSEIADSIKGAAQQGAQQVSKTVSETAGQVTQGAQRATDKVGGELGLAGSAELTIDVPLQTKACFAKLIASPAGRPSVLQLQSYRDSRDETFPSVFVRAQVPTGGLAGLHGQTLSAQVFVQPAANGPTWFAKTAPVPLKITAVDDKQLTAEIAGGTLSNSQTGAAQPVKGIFRGAVQ